MFLPFYHFLYLSHLLIFNPASPLPFPILLILNSPPLSSLFFSALPEPSAAPQDIKCSSASSTSLRVSWRPPPLESQNGALVGYRVHYQVVGPSEGGGMDEDFLQEAATSAGEEQVVLQRLEKWTQYRISVSASTVVGPGPESEPLICRTDEDGTALLFSSSRIFSIHSCTVKHLSQPYPCRLLRVRVWVNLVCDFKITLSWFLSFGVRYRLIWAHLLRALRTFSPCFNILVSLKPFQQSKISNRCMMGNNLNLFPTKNIIIFRSNK